MRKKSCEQVFALLLAVVMVMSMTGIAHAVTYNLTADTTTVTMPDGAIVPMAGFGLTGEVVTVPGPVLEAVEGDTLTINLTNNLSYPVTVILHGQRIDAPAPVIDAGRVRSFVPESGTFNFPGLRAGTYLYESGTHPSLEVPLGLYGVLIVRPETAGQAYADPISQFDAEQALVLSDVDPTLNEAWNAATYGTPVYPSTVNYRGQYFLINGLAYPDTAPIVTANGDRLLLRFANAGTQTYVPMLYGTRMLVIAEDGYPLTYPQSVSALVLHAGKTADVIVTPADDTSYALFDRRLNLSNAGADGPGGMRTGLYVGAAALDLAETVMLTSVAAHDGWVLESNETSGIGGSNRAGLSGRAALRVGDDNARARGERQYKSILSFDTSAIPDGAVIMSAQIRLRQGNLVGSNPFLTHGTCFVDVATGSFGAVDLANTDFQAAATSTEVATMSNPVGNGGISTGDLSAAGLAAIDVTGFTQFRIYFSLDDNNDNGDDYVGFRAGDDLVVGNRPVLEVTYLGLP